MNSKIPQKKIQLVSFDGGFKSTTILQTPDKYRNLKSKNIDVNLIPRGAGLSYTAASFGNGTTSISTKFFNRILGFDNDKKQVKVESGITLRELYQFLIKHQYYLKVQPGCSFISIGGCIAADVHGKNPFLDGTFLSQVVSLNLFHPMHGEIELSRDKNPEIFYLTCGGYGLTGIILSVVLQASKLTSSIVKTDLLFYDSFMDGVNLLKDNSLNNDFTYSWNNFSLGAQSIDSGIIFRGNIKNNLIFNDKELRYPLISSDRRPHLTFNMFKSFVPKLSNNLYEYINSKKLVRFDTIYDSLYAAERNFMYFRMYGTKGFHEYQALLPEDSIDEYHQSVKHLSKKYKIPITLAVLKNFNGKRSYLKFDGDGFGLSINIPRNNISAKMLFELDGILIYLGGWPNIIKDSRLSQQCIEAAYPEYSLFKKKLHEFDPKRIFKSELSERVGL